MNFYRLVQFWIGVLLFTGFSTKPQELDRLKVSLSETQGYDYAISAKEIGIFYLRQNSYDSAEKYFDVAIGKARQINEYQLLGKCLNNKGVSNYLKGQFKEAVLLYQEALEVYRMLENDTLLSQSLTNLGLTFKSLGIYNKSLEYLYESATILESLDLKKELSANWNAIGNIHRDLNNAELSLQYLERSHNLRKEIGYGAGIAQSLHNIGIWYLEEQDLTKALEYLDEALSLKLELGNKKDIATTLSKIGEINYQLNKFEKAEEYFTRSYQIRKELKDEAGIAVCSNQLAALYLKTRQYNRAKEYLDVAQEIAVRSNMLSEQTRVYTLFKEFFTTRKDYLRALHYSDLLAEVRLTILDEEKAKSLMEAEIRYEVDRKEQEIIESQIKLKFLQQRTYWLIAFATFLVTLILVLVRLYYLASKLSKERKQGKEKVENLLRELHHRTKNHLQAQSSLIRLQTQYLADDSTKDIMLEVGNRMKAVSLIHQSLYSSDKDPSEKINLSDYLKNLTENLMISFKYNRNKMQLEYNLPPVDIDIYSAVPIGLFVNEAITNAFKHAYKNVRFPYLSVEIIKDNLNLIIRVTDNGLGHNDNSLDSKSFGITLMKDVATQLKGTFEIHGEEGTTVELTIPVKRKSRQLKSTAFLLN